MGEEASTPAAPADLTAILGAAREALEAGDAPAAALAANQGWELILAAERRGEALAPELIAEARRLVDGCLQRAGELRADLLRQIDSTGTSRRALDAYSGS